jgi:hypothetical protein
VSAAKERTEASGCLGAGVRTGLWLVGAAGAWVVWVVLVRTGGPRHAETFGLDVGWPWHFQRWLIVLPAAEMLALLGWGAWYVWRSTRAQLDLKVEYGWLPSDEFDPSEEEVAHVVTGLATMPREPRSSWAYPGAMATRTSLRAWGEGKVLMTVTVPAERAGEPIRTALDLIGAELRPIAELGVEPMEPPALPVPVEEQADV